MVCKQSSSFYSFPSILLPIHTSCLSPTSIHFSRIRRRTCRCRATTHVTYDKQAHHVITRWACATQWARVDRLTSQAVYAHIFLYTIYSTCLNHTLSLCYVVLCVFAIQSTCGNSTRECVCPTADECHVCCINDNGECESVNAQITTNVALPDPTSSAMHAYLRPSGACARVCAQ